MKDSVFVIASTDACLLFDRKGRYIREIARQGDMLFAGKSDNGGIQVHSLRDVVGRIPVDVLANHCI